MNKMTENLLKIHPILVAIDFYEIFEAINDEIK